MKELTTQEQSIIDRIVSRTYRKRSARDIADELKLDYDKVKKLMRTSEYKQAIKDELKTKISALAPLVIDALEANLKEGNIKAVEQWGKLIGAYDQPNQKEKAPGLTIVLPGAQSPFKDVKSEVVNEVPETIEIKTK